MNGFLLMNILIDNFLILFFQILFPKSSFRFIVKLKWKYRVPSTLHMPNLPHYQYHWSEWYISYRRWTYIDISFHSLPWDLLSVYILILDINIKYNPVHFHSALWLFRFSLPFTLLYNVLEFFISLSTIFNKY